MHYMVVIVFSFNITSDTLDILKFISLSYLHLELYHIVLVELVELLYLVIKECCLLSYLLVLLVFVFELIIYLLLV